MTRDNDAVHEVERLLEMEEGMPRREFLQELGEYAPLLAQQVRELRQELGAPVPPFVWEDEE